jgi:CBS domain-containing protein
MAETSDRSVPRAKDLMEEIRLTFAPDMDLLQAIEMLARHGVSAAPVVDSQRCLRGILTEKDCLRLLYDSALHRSRGGRVADFMSQIDESLDIDMDIFRISEVFLHNNFPMLPVVDQGKLVGCVNRHHMLRGIMSMAEAEESGVVKIEADAERAVERPRSIGEMQQVFASYSKSQLVSRLGRKGR